MTYPAIQGIKAKTTSPAIQGKTLSPDIQAKTTTNLKKTIETGETNRGIQTLAIPFSTRSLQSTGKRDYQEWTDIVTDITTYLLTLRRCRFSENIPFFTPA